MRPFAILPALFLAVNAQYFSDGWSPPGSSSSVAVPTPTRIVAPPLATPTRITPLGLIKKASSMLEINNILSSRPVSSLFSLAGINITEKLENITIANQIWDERIPLITDDNYEDMIVNERLTEEEEGKRTWFLIISAYGVRQDGLSKYSDEIFDAVYNETILAKDLPHVRFGRIDYLNVTRLTTKWNIWNAPWLVVVRDHGQSLRFFKTQHVRIKTDIMREFLLQESWKQTPPWTSSFGPGGSNEWIMNYLGMAMALLYNQTNGLPKWLLYMISGAVGSVLLGALHKGSSAPAAAAAPQAVEGATTATAGSAATRATSTPAQTKGSLSKRSGKGKKGGKQ